MSNYGEAVDEQANLTGQDGANTMEGQKKAFFRFLAVTKNRACKGVLKQQTTGKFLHRHQLLAR